MPTALQNIFRFFILVLFQVLVLNNIQFLGYINPYLYVLFILALPVRIPHWFLLLLAFAIGLTVDIFANTPGIHSFATVLVAFIRPHIIRLFTAIEEGNNPTPSFKTFGISAYVKYAVSIVLIHNASLFLLEAFSFYGLGITIVKILLNSLVTLFLILGIQSIKTN